MDKRDICRERSALLEYCSHNSPDQGWLKPLWNWNQLWPSLEFTLEKYRWSRRFYTRESLRGANGLTVMKEQPIRLMCSQWIIISHQVNVCNCWLRTREWISLLTSTEKVIAYSVSFKGIDDFAVATNEKKKRVWRKKDEKRSKKRDRPLGRFCQ